MFPPVFNTIKNKLIVLRIWGVHGKISFLICRSIANPPNQISITQELGEKAIRGIGDILNREGFKLHLPSSSQRTLIHHNIYTQLEAEGHEIGLHTITSVRGMVTS